VTDANVIRKYAQRSVGLTVAMGRVGSGLAFLICGGLGRIS